MGNICIAWINWVLYSLRCTGKFGLVLAILLTTKALRTVKNLHFFILFAVSILNALIYYFYLLLTYHSDFEVLDLVCNYLYGWSIEVIYNISMTTLLGMCLERLISVIEPLWFSIIWMTEKQWRNLGPRYPRVAGGRPLRGAPFRRKFVFS